MEDIEENTPEQNEDGNDDDSVSNEDDGELEEEPEHVDNNDEAEDQDSDGIEEEVEGDKKSSDNKGNEKSTEDQLVDVTYDIFAAQRKLDFDYLESVLSKGSKIDRDKKVFIFNNVKYPHEQEILDGIKEEHLEYRYTHEEDKDSIIVGFAAIDYENESSFTIDFQYIKENGNWKMNDMDINK